MDIVTIDFETYYDKKYSLKKLTTEAYVRDPQFEVIGVGVKVNNYPTDWYSGSDVGGFLNSLDYSDKAILAHNAAFDGAILSWHYGIKPKLWLDTLSMARPIHNVTVGGSLKALAEHYEIGAKGTEVLNAEAKRRADFTPEELDRYAEYCVNDVDLTYQLFKKLSKGFPVSELMVIDQTLRMYTEPTIMLDTDVLAQHLQKVRADKSNLLQGLGLKGLNEAQIKKALMSNEIFAKLLLSLGVEPPTKTSLRTGKQAWAFAKTDKPFLSLLEHDNPQVASLVAARLGTKSTIEETRTENLMHVAERGRLPIMLNYYGAHTGRFSGGDKLNLQNLPRNGAIRSALAAPDGHILIACDSSQIEARMVAYVAGQDDLVQAFREGRDVYSEFATEVYGRKITKADKVERFVGKTCVAEGTLVLCDSGWKPIEQVSLGDKLWDGENWVCHQGLLSNGIKPTLNLCGSWLTPDHQVWSGTQWLEAQLVAADAATLYRALDTAAENLPSQATSLAPVKESEHLSSSATATKPSTPLTNRTSKILRVLAALSVLRKHLLQNAIGYIAKQWQTINTGLACLTASLRQSLAATPQQTGRISTTGYEVLKFVMSGGTTELRFYDTYRPLMGGITQNWKWIGSMSTGTMNRETYGSYRGAITSVTNAGSLILKPVYDILNSGSRNRFTILTDAGPIIVHNCILGLGYGMGAKKFRDTLALGQGGISVDIDENEAERIVRLYRQKNHKIVALWNICGHALTSILGNGSGVINEVISYDKDGLRLPNNLLIKYPALRSTANGFEYISDARTYKKYMADPSVEVEWTRIYGGKVTENIVQALARIVVAEQMASVGQDYHVAFQVHDEIIIVVPEAEAASAQQLIEKKMSTAPVWARDLPVACESGVGHNYGEAK